MRKEYGKVLREVVERKMTSSPFGWKLPANQTWKASHDRRLPEKQE